MKRYLYSFPPGSLLVSAVLFTLFVLFIPGASSVEALLQDNPACRTCGDTGLMPCKKHSKADLEMEEGALFCSEMIRCTKCGGTLKVDCKKCRKDVSAQIEQASEEKSKWLEKMTQIDTYMKAKEVMHCESEHFILTFNLKTISPEKRAFRTHGGMHLYLQRLEEYYTYFLKDLGGKDKDMLAKTHVMIWQREHELVRAASKYCRQDSNTKSYLLGAAPIFTIFYNKGFLHEEYELHQAVLHGVSHCLLSNIWDGIWPGTIKGAWVCCGYAHFVELRHFTQYGGAVRNYFYREGDQNVNFRFGKWEATVRTEVDKGEAPSFLEVTSKNIDQMVPRDHMFAWSFVDFILKEYPTRFGEVVRLVKRRVPIGEVTKKGLEMTPFQFEEEWQDYVKTKYSLKPPTPANTSRRIRR